MSISINNVSFNVSYNGATEQTPFEFPMTEQVFLGVAGGYTLRSPPTYRTLMVDVNYSGYGSRGALDSDLTLLADRVGEFGDLDIDGSVFPNCTFQGFQLPPPAHDPAKDHWWTSGRMTFRQQTAQPTAAAP